MSQVRALLCVLGLLLYGVQELNQCRAAELTCLVEEGATSADNLVRILTNAEFRQFIRSDVHTDFLGLSTQCIVHQHHLPYLIAQLSVQILIEIGAAGLYLVHLYQLLTSSLIRCVVHILTLDGSDVLAFLIK